MFFLISERSRKAAGVEGFIRRPVVATANTAFFTLRRFKCTNPLNGASADCKLTFTYTSRGVYETTIRLKLEPLGSAR